MTGSSDGVLKVFRNYESVKDVEIVTAFRALPELIPSNRNAGLVLDWQQGQGKALVAGDVKVIRVWNAATEVCTNVSPFILGTSFFSDSAVLGYSCTFRIVHHFVDLRPSRRQHLRSWVWRRRCPSL